ncbi:MAG: hypothetical protein WC683_11725 [bacterium]
MAEKLDPAVEADALVDFMLHTEKGQSYLRRAFREQFDALMKNEPVIEARIREWARAHPAAT